MQLTKRNFFVVRLEKNYAKTILEMSRPNIAPALHAKLLTYQPTSASVEVSFSIINPFFMKTEISPMHTSHSIIKLYSTVEYLTCCKMHI